MRSLSTLLAAIFVLSSCQNPLPSANDGRDGPRALQLTWTLPLGRTLLPTTYPTPITYEVLLHPLVGADRYQQGLTGQSWLFDDLTAAVYTVNLKGKNASGDVLVQGTTTVDLTWAASATRTVVLQYLTSGPGTGQIHLTLDLAAAPESVVSAGLTMTDPKGNVSHPTMVGNTVYTDLVAPVGSYRLYLVVQTATKTALKMESLVVAQNVDTAVTLPFGAGDFNATYVPVTSLTLNKTSGTIGLTSETLTPTFNAGASNTLLVWTSNNAAVTVDAQGNVVATALGSATVTATSVDNPNLSASCTYVVKGMVGYDANGATSGSVPVDTGPYTLNDPVIVKANTGPLVKTGYIFRGWNTQADGLGTAYAPGSTLTMGTTLPTLYAQWAPAWEVFYQAGAATSGTVPIDPAKYQQDAPVTVLPNSGTLAVVGLTFVGWNTQANGLGTTYHPGDTLTMGTANQTLYAQFAATHTVTYLADDATSGTPPTDGANYSLGAEATIAANPGLLLKTGYLFAGWNTQADRLGTTWAPGAFLIMGSANVTLYPVWVPNNLTFSASGNDITITGYLVSKPTGTLVIPAGVTEIGMTAFRSCTSITSLVLPNSLQIIGPESFSDCLGITSLSIPTSLDSIGPAAFNGCSNLSDLIMPPGVKSIMANAFSFCKNLSTVVIPSSVSFIGDTAFGACTGITSLTIPGSISTFGNYVFIGCTSLVNLTLSPGFRGFASYEFEDCTSLVTVTLPASITGLGLGNFFNCTSLTTLTLQSVVPPTLPDTSKLIQNTAVTAIHVPAGSLAAYQAAPGWSEYIGLLVAP